jgi:predicted TIM-barrel fold metal-dependent hydrolase
VLLGAIAEWPERQELEWICANLENLYFVLDANVLASTPPWVRGFLASPCGRDRCCWGSYGVAWESALQQFHQLGLPEEVERRLLRDNATRLFRLEGEFKVTPRPQAVLDPMAAER